VRELKNVITRAALLCEGEILTSHLGLGGVEAVKGCALAPAPENFDLKENLRQARAETERRLICAALTATNGNKVKAAKLLSIDRKALYDKIKTYSLD